MIVRHLSKNEFRDEFLKMGRDNQFSYKGLTALYDYLDEFHDEIPYELDVIEICCNFTEYDSLQDFNKDYSREYENIDEILDDTEVVRIDDNRFIIQNF